MMTPAQLADLRADINVAMAHSNQDDPSLLPELLGRLLDELGRMATKPPIAAWAESVLEACQIRAVSGIPFAYATLDNDQYWGDHL